MESIDSNKNEFKQKDLFFKEFKSKSQILINLLKQNEKYNDIIEAFNSLNNKNIYLILLFFQNYNKWITIRLEKEDDIFQKNNDNILEKYLKIKEIIDRDKKIGKNNNIFELSVQWYYFLYTELLKNIYTNSTISNSDLNKIRYVLSETNISLIKLYKSHILNSANIFNILNFYLFLIESNFDISSNTDKLFLLKNYILLKGLFFIFQEVSIIILEESNFNDKDIEKTRNNIQKIFLFMEDMKNSKELNSQRNSIIIIKYNLVQDFMNKILEKLDFKIFDKYEPDFKNKLINFYSQFIKSNYKKSKIFEIMIKSIKQSFISLYNFGLNKEKIICDLLIQEFYTQLNQKVFLSEENPNCGHPLYNAFFFNGFDSQISLRIPNKLQNCKFLENSSLFFSFYLLPIKNKIIYPLIAIDKEDEKDKNKLSLFNIFLKKIEKEEEYELYLLKDNIEKKILTQVKIKSNITYYVNVTFSNKVNIYIYNGKNKIFEDQLDKIKFDQNFFNLNIGHLKKGEKNEAFSGYFGPVIVINPFKVPDIIQLTLNLKNNYHNFIFLDQYSNYSFEYINSFNINKSNTDLAQIRKNYEKINKFDCLLYLTPDIVSFYNQNSEKNHLPNVGYVSKYQKIYEIINLNVTLVKNDQGMINFITDNGISYICLLYEYIYQFLRNYTEQKDEFLIQNNELVYKIISSILKETLGSLERIHYQFNEDNLTKYYKQIYMNLFSCIKLISPNYTIIDDIINYIYNIITYYRSKISEYNNDKLKINLSFYIGFIDFLLAPELYNFNNTKTLIILFDRLSHYFCFEEKSKASILINKYFYLKLLSFSPHLFEENGNTSESTDNINSEKKEVLDFYLGALKSFFENNPSKSENYIMLKDFFNFVNDNASDNYQIGLEYYNLIEDLIGNNPDLYFNNEGDESQIENLLQYAIKYSKKKESKINNILFNKLISIIMRIIFTKQRINKNNNIVLRFKEIIKKVDISIDLIKTITEEIRKIIDYSIGASKNNKSKKKKMDSSKKDKKVEGNYTSEELKYISNFYSEIFDLIFFFLEYAISGQNININNFSQIEEEICLLLAHIEQMIKANIDNSVNMDTNNDKENNINLNDINGIFTIDTIYCLIYSLKLYNHILFKRLYPENFITNFIDVCQLCCKSCLINSNILVDIGTCTKTVLEIILDICIYYIINSSRYYYEPGSLSFEEINGVNNVQIIWTEHKIIYNFLENLLQKNNNNKNKEFRQKFTIFYNNDYLRLLTEYINNKKKIKKELNYDEYIKEFNNYKIINSFLLNEKKFNFNFSTFFLIKIIGFTKLLISLNVKIKELLFQNKSNLKVNDLLQLLVETKRIIYKEHESLFSTNKDFFFLSKKANNSNYSYYNQVKNRIVNLLKKSKEIDIHQFDNFVNEIFKSSKENVFNSIYSGLCYNKETKLSLSFSLSGHKKSDDLTDLKSKTDKKNNKSRCALSSDNLIQIEENNLRISSKIKSKTMEVKQINSPISSNSQIKKENLSNNDDDSELELYFDEGTPSSESYTNSNTLIESEKKDNNTKNKLILSPPPQIQRSLIRMKTLSSSKMLDIKYLNNNETDFKKERSMSFYTTSSKGSHNLINNNDKIIPFINFFDEPDECYLKNAKKELMMNVFSYFFFDSFFYSNKFEQLKYFYFQNFEGIQTSTKMINFPSKIKNYSNGLEPPLFLKPFSNFYTTKVFPITHKYFYDYMKQNHIYPEPIILYQKIIPEFNLKNQFDKKCELIKVDQNYYGHIIGSKDFNFIVFEEQSYGFHENKNSILNKSNIKSGDFDDLFTLSLVSRKPLSKNQEKILNNLEKNIFEQNSKKRDKKYVIILFSEIEQILERRFLLMWQALEIYLKNGKSYFFNFITLDGCKSILEIFKKNNITKDKIQEKNYFKNQKYITAEWVEERLTTYEYLLFLNKYSSRTYNDPNQYPIFPWLIQKYSEIKENKEEGIERILKYPMAAQTEENQKSAIVRFEDDEDNKSKFPAHFGTHYSTSAYVYFYLMRNEPYTTLLVKLQGYKHENPDRTFFSIKEVLNVLATGHDNREMVPELFYKIGPFLNLNCNDFGMKSNNLRVDDFITYEKPTNNEINGNYVKYIISNRKKLNGKIISNKINDWIDIIFGNGQLPEKNRKKCLNIFYKETYEQKTNLHKKFQNLILKKRSNEDIIKKITNKIDLILSFGQTPYQLFNDKHPKYGKKNSNEEDDFESTLSGLFAAKEIKSQIQLESLFFIINPNLGKIFIIDKERNIEIYDSPLHNNSSGNEKYQFNKAEKLELSHIKFLEKINTKEDDNFAYYIYKQKYCISSFNEDKNYILNKESEKKNKYLSTKQLDIKSFSKISSNNNINDIENKQEINYTDFNNNNYISYYNNYVNQLKIEEIKKSKKSKEDEYFRFITCRYIDNSFKIYNVKKSKSSTRNAYMPMSFICEDFVSSCCTISANKFLVGLRNGKLAQWSIENDIGNDDSYKKQNLKEKIIVKFNKQIQAHRGAINVIEIDHKLGIIITAGDDNYIFIRKIYDFELLIPIKFKSKYIITMAKISPMNFLYVMCFNKIKQKSVIFGYTVNGLKFCKSKYEYYDTLDFTKSGNIVTWIHKKELQILESDNLKCINPKDKDFEENQNELKDASWVKFNYFLKKYDQEPNTKIITYTICDNNNTKFIRTLNVSKYEYFD